MYKDKETQRASNLISVRKYRQKKNEWIKSVVRQLADCEEKLKQIGATPTTMQENPSPATMTGNRDGNV